MASLLHMQDLGDGRYEVHEFLLRSSAVPSAVAAKTAAFTATDAEMILLVDATGGAVTITLPTAVGRTGQAYEVKRTSAGANAVTVDGAGTETIDGALTASLATQYATVRVVSDGTNWMIF